MSFFPSNFSPKRNANDVLVLKKMTCLRWMSSSTVCWSRILALLF